MSYNNKLLLESTDIKPSFPGWEVKGVLNPGVVRAKNKKIVMFARVAEMPIQHGKTRTCPVVMHGGKFKPTSEKISVVKIVKKKGNLLYLKDGTCRLTTFSHLRKIVLNKDGFDIEKISQTPSFTGTAHEGQYGVEDPRITKLKNQYAMTYVSVSLNEGVSTALAISKDLVTWKRKGIIFSEQNKDTVIFPEKIKGKYVALHRPEGFFEFSKPSIWISYSPDLIYWGKEKSIMQPRKNSWESKRIGAGAVPIKTKEGWLEIYHGVHSVNEKKIYNAGAVLLDLKNPEKILARSPKKKPLFHPTKKYEKKGFINNVVFPTAAIPSLSGKNLLIYYGAADSSIAVKKMPIKKILNSMKYLK